MFRKKVAEIEIINMTGEEAQAQTQVEKSEEIWSLYLRTL